MTRDPVTPATDAAPDEPIHPKTSGAAIASLVLGLILCIPLLTQAAVICGFLGIKATSRPHVSGRGIAIAGLVLGIVGFLGWAGFGVAGWRLYASSRIPKRIIEQYITDLAAGGVHAVLAASVSSVSRQQIQETIDHLNTRGSLRNIRFARLHASGSLSGTTT